MIKRFGKLQAILASISLLLSFAAANQACALFAHQSELPDSVRKMRRF
ncbi:cyclic lactone autoinducer peptide [Gudongella sp. SC589]